MSLPGRRLRAWRSSWAVHLLPGALLAAAVLVVAWPQAGTWTGSGRDLGLWVWRDWWFRLMMGDLLAGRTPPVESLEILLTGGVGPNLFSPVDLYLFSLPSWLVGTGAAAWNLKVAMVLAANAVGGYILGLAVARDRWAALLAGALMAFICGTPCGSFLLFSWPVSSISRIPTNALAPGWPRPRWPGAS